MDGVDVDEVGQIIHGRKQMYALGQDHADPWWSPSHFSPDREVCIGTQFRKKDNGPEQDLSSV